MGEIVVLHGADRAPFNAKVEIDERGIVIHSRSGTTRNRDYRPALELVLSALDEACVEYSIFLDSSRVQHLPLHERELEFDRTTGVAVRFNLIVNAMNEKSDSHGAWRRLLNVVDDKLSSRLSQILRAKPEKQSSSLLPTAELRKVTYEHIQKAVNMLRSGEMFPSLDLPCTTM